MGIQVLYNKKALCYIDKADFCDIQGIGSTPLYNIYESVESIVNKYITEEYRGFLAQPVVNNATETIEWYAHEWKEIPVHYTQLDGKEKMQYEQIKDETINCYTNALDQIENSDEKNILKGAIKYLCDEYIYCYDGKVVLGIWGMKHRANLHKSFGEIIHDYDECSIYKITFDVEDNAVFSNHYEQKISRRQNYILTKEDLPVIKEKEGCRFVRWIPEPIGYKIDNDCVFKALFEKSYEVRFNAGDYGTFTGGLTEDFIFELPEGEIISSAMIPEVIPQEGYKFVGWSSLPENFQIDKDIVFTAKYEKKIVEQKANIIDDEDIPVSPKRPDFPDPEVDEYICAFDAGDNGTIKGDCEIRKNRGYVISSGDIPVVEPHEGYRFIGWDMNPEGCSLTKNIIFKAKYEEDNKKMPWYKRFWFSNGCLRRLLWLLLLLLLLLLLWFILRSCLEDRRAVPVLGTNESGPVIGLPDNIYDGEVIDPNTGIVYDNEYLPKRLGVPPFKDEDGNLLPYSETPDGRNIFNNLIDIYFEDKPDLNQFAVDFKKEYPGEEFEIVGFDPNIPMVQLFVPAEKREMLLNELSSKLSQYKMYVVEVEKLDINGGMGFLKESGTDSGWHLKAVNAYEAWKITKGNEDIVIAVVDDGIDIKHNLLKNKIIKSYNVFTQSTTVSVGEGHGTHVAGLAAADSELDKGVSGIAPLCKIMPIQVFDGENTSTTAWVNGIMYAIHNGADVINTSITTVFKSDIPHDVQEELIRNKFKIKENMWKWILNTAKKYNSILVFSAGNNSVLTNLPPEHRTGCSLNVTAIGKDFKAAEFTNYGDGSVIAAPGVDIYSTFPVNSYNYCDGTSMAAPIVAGAVALMKSVKKDLTVEQISNILIKTGKNIDSNVGPLIQVDKALIMLRNGDYEEHPQPIQKLKEHEEGWVDYESIRRKIKEHQHQIEELKKQLPEYKK